MIITSLVNLALSVLTLSLWRFWGRTRVRRLLWRGVEAWGDPVDYVGTGKELFIGFLVVLALVYMPLAALYGWANLMLSHDDPRGGLLIGGLYLVTVFLIHAGLYRARRYQLSRTVWRGIRGGQGGLAWRYGLMAVAIWLLFPLTLGWIWPWGEMALARYKLRHTRFGDRAFSCEATAGGLYRRFAVAWLCGAGCGAMVVLGALSMTAAWASGVDMRAMLVALSVVSLLIMVLPWAWYRAGFYRRLAAGTGYVGASFAVDIRTWGVLRLYFGNLVITVFSLGVLRPWAALRLFRYACAVISVSGEPDFAAIAQNSDARPGSGEGLISVLDGAGEF